MKRLLLLILFVARLVADSALTTATENKALYATTIATTADIGGNATVGGTLGVTNNATFGGTVGITGNTTIGGTLGITGNTTIGGLLLQPTHALTTSTTLTAAHQFVTVNDTAGDVVLTLADPTVLTNVNVTLMKRTGTNRTTFTSTALINGIANTMPLPILEAITLRSNGATWNILSAADNTIFNLFTAATTTLTVGDIRNAYYDNAASITVNLPSATNFSTLGRIYYHKKTGGLNTTTLDPAGSETIDGAATLTLSTLGGVAIYSDLSNWYVISSSGLGAGSGDALVANPLSQFAATTSAQLAGVISDETGSGALVFGTAPQISTIELGHASDTTLARSAAGKATIEGVPIATQPTTETLTYSSTTVTVTAGKGPNQSSLLTVTNAFTLAWSGLTDNDSGVIVCVPAATNCTVTLPTGTFSTTGATATIFGGTGNTNYTLLAWKVTPVGGTNLVFLNAPATPGYYR
jgi:fibronectin-binding autotransporter adhesin